MVRCAAARHTGAQVVSVHVPVQVVMAQGGAAGFNIEWVSRPNGKSGS